jgi:adenosylcobinamide kinase/adenosylcobinamide-phosphate guanylyltransferase
MQSANSGAQMNDYHNGVARPVSQTILITGGSRSGKSSYALKLGESLEGPRLFVATCVPSDDEMRARVKAHRQKRSECGWTTIEEPADIFRVLYENHSYRVTLVDCLTLWVSNLLLEGQSKGVELTESDIESRCRAILEVCRSRDGTFLFVTNEVGAGIVPANALARRFRDLAGRCNQVMAEGADAVTLMVCGLPLQLKGQSR